MLFPVWKNHFELNTLSNVSELKVNFKKVIDMNLCRPIRDFEVKFMIKKDAVPVVITTGTCMFDVKCIKAKGRKQTKINGKHRYIITGFSK